MVDEAILQYEAEEADVARKSVLEIGAGDGRLTSRLLKCNAGHVVAVEFDPKLAKLLRQKFAGAKRVKVHEGDFLEFDETARFNVIVGNIPYYITSPILLKLSRMDFGKAILCVQKEVAERMAAPSGSGNYGRLSVSCQLAFNVEILALVPRIAFSPVPKVDSCIVSLEKTGARLGEREERAIGALFSHKKKSVKNAVVDARMELFKSKSKEAALAVAQTLKYSERKVFTLSPSEAYEVAEQVSGKMV